MGNDFRSRMPVTEGRVLVTGGSGFIGRRLVAALADAGTEVTVADLKPFPGSAEAGSPGPSVQVLGDLCDPEIADQAVAPGTDTIIHLAARTSVLESVKDPQTTYRNNVALTAGLLELARQRRVRTFLFASTNAVVGNVGGAVITERAPLRPLTPYGATKASSEMLINCYAASYGVRGVSLRFSNVYGPGMQHKDSFIPRLMRAARDGTGVKVRGDGTMIRDVIQVDEANLPGSPEEWEWAAEGMNVVLDAIPTVPAVHLCFGNYGGQTIQKGSWGRLIDYLNKLHVNHIVMENAHRPPEELAVFRELRPEIGFGLGVVDIKQTVVESADAIARAIEHADKVLGVGRVKYIHPDCGFWMLKRGIADGKIRALVLGRDLYEGRN